MRSLTFADRPYEFAVIINENREFFTAMHAILPFAKYRQLGNLWKMPREFIDDEDWVEETMSVVMSGMGNDAGHGVTSCVGNPILKVRPTGRK